VRRNRLHLAMTLKEEGNVLLLDEPTNDLDVNTLSSIRRRFDNFAGCAAKISMMMVLDCICTHILLKTPKHTFMKEAFLGIMKKIRKKTFRWRFNPKA
jgi:ATPase subunit of ABC transporter with duplicated ATPase domains